MNFCPIAQHSQKICSRIIIQCRVLVHIYIPFYIIVVDLESWASGSILTGGNILLLFCVCFHVFKTLKSIMALLPTLFNYEKTRLELLKRSSHLNRLVMRILMTHVETSLPMETVDGGPADVVETSPESSADIPLIPTPV